MDLILKDWLSISYWSSFSSVTSAGLSSSLILTRAFGRCQTMVGLKANARGKQAGSHLDTLKDGIVFLQAKWQKCFKIVELSLHRYAQLLYVSLLN